MLATGLGTTAPFPQVVGLPETAVVFACFVVAVVLVDAFDIGLPRGDSISVSGALVSAALAVLGTVVGAAVGVVAVVVSAIARQVMGRSGAPLRTLTVRAASVLVASTVAQALTWGSQYLSLWAMAVVASTYLFVELAAMQIACSIETSRGLGRLIRGNLERQGLMLLAQLSAAELIFITFGNMRAWALIPVVALLLLMRQSYAMLLDMRETYRTTVEVLVEVSEQQDVRRMGHGERTAAIARDIGARAGLSARDLERLSLAALLHDVDAIGDEAGSGRRESDQPDACTRGRSASLLEDAHFFEEVMPILRACDGDGLMLLTQSEVDQLSAMIIALASDVDCARTGHLQEVHAPTMVPRVAPAVPGSIKARAVSAAIELGYQVPAVP